MTPTHVVGLTISDLDYAALAARLPDHVEPAYDGMRLQIADGAVVVEEPAAAAP